MGTKLDDKISIHDSASLNDLRAQILGMVPPSISTFQPSNQFFVSHRRKPLSGTRTIREERLEGGDVVDVTVMPVRHPSLDVERLYDLQLAEGGSEDVKSGNLYGSSNTTQPSESFTQTESIHIGDGVFESTTTPLLSSQSHSDETGTQRPVRQDGFLPTDQDGEQDQIHEESHNAAPPEYVKRDPSASLLSQTQPQEQDGAEDGDADPDEELDVYFDAKAHILPYNS